MCYLIFDFVVPGIKLGRTKATNIINKIVCRVETDNLIELLKLKLFSVLVDESTDLVGDKFLCVLVKFVEDEVERTQLLKMIHLNASDTSAEALFNQFRDFFVSQQVPLQNIIGLSTDNASEM